MGVDPVTMAIVAGVQAVSAIYGGIQQKNAANRQAALMKQEAEAEAQIERDAADDLRRRQKVLYLKSGVRLEGSPLLVMRETTRQGEQNAQTIRQTGYAQASEVRKQGRDAFVGSFIQAGAQSAKSYGDLSGGFNDNKISGTSTGGRATFTPVQNSGKFTF